MHGRSLRDNLQPGILQFSSASSFRPVFSFAPGIYTPPCPSPPSFTGYHCLHLPLGHTSPETACLRSSHCKIDLLKSGHQLLPLPELTRRILNYTEEGREHEA